jgi:chaperonin GroES
MKILPIQNRVLVKRDTPTEKIGSIIVPDTAKVPVTRGTVLAVGPGKVLDNGRRIEPTVKTGDKILFGKYSGSEFEDDGEKRLFMTEDEILGVVEEE